METAECERRAREMMADRLADAMDELQGGRGGGGGAGEDATPAAQGDRAPSAAHLKEALEAVRIPSPSPHTLPPAPAPPRPFPLLLSPTLYLLSWESG